MPRLVHARPQFHWSCRPLPEILKPVLWGSALALCLVWVVLLSVQTQRMRLAVEDLEYLQPSLPAESLTASISAAQE